MAPATKGTATQATVLLLLLLACGAPVVAGQAAELSPEEVAPPPAPEQPSLYDSGLTAADIQGHMLDLASLRGKVTLVVNVASQCGYTQSNYEALQRILDVYHDHGFEVLAFPCNQFGQQEPGTHEEIRQFVESSFGPKIRLMSKVDVNGAGAHPIFQFLKQYTLPLEGHAANEELNWNFNKFLLDKFGHPVKRYGPEIDTQSLATDIYNELMKGLVLPSDGSAAEAQTEL